MNENLPQGIYSEEVSGFFQLNGKLQEEGLVVLTIPTKESNDEIQHKY